MATLKANLLKLAQRVDPYTKQNVEFTESTIGVEEGSGFTSQRLLDIYNEARIVLVGQARNIFGEDWVDKIGGALVSSPITWTSNLASIPAGYMSFTEMHTAAGIPIYLVSADLIPEISAGTNPFYLQSATNLHIVEVGANFKHYGSYSMPDASNYVITYWGITEFTLANLSSSETINFGLIPILIQLAEAIALEQGSAQVNALATQLLGDKS